MCKITKENIIEWLSSQSTQEIVGLAKDLEGKWCGGKSEPNPPNGNTKEEKVAGEVPGNPPAEHKQLGNLKEITNPETIELEKPDEQQPEESSSDSKLPIESTDSANGSSTAVPVSVSGTSTGTTTSTATTALTPAPTPRTYKPGRNPGPAFEEWVKINWEKIATNSSGCIKAPLALSDTENCSKDWFDLKSTPPFARNEGANPPNGTPFGKCDFTNIPATTPPTPPAPPPPTPPAPPPPPFVFIECKAKGKASSINLSARCYALLEAAKAAKHEPWVIICRDYEWKPATPPAGTTATEFQPNHVIIIGPGVLNKLIPPPATLPSNHTGTTCCTINENTTSTTSRPPAVDFENINHPVGIDTSESELKNTHPTKVEIYA